MTKEEIVERIRHLDRDQLLQLQRLLDQLAGQKESPQPASEPDPEETGSG